MDHRAKLLPFPKIVDKVQICEFLEASKRLVLLLDDLGRVFAPLSYDMMNNINKIEKGREASDWMYFEDMLLDEKINRGGIVADAVLWLKRSLDFFLVFFQCLIRESNGPESLETAMETAYDSSLKSYHGWVTRQLFSIFKKTCPSRSVVQTILGQRLLADEDLMIKLEEFCAPMEQNIKHLDAFFDLHCLGDSKIST